MPILSHSPPGVDSDWEPLDGLDGAEPFHPSPSDEAYDLGWRLGRSGENPLCPFRGTTLAMRFLIGREDGKVARQVAEARELGEAVAFLTPISEPPPGFSDAERAAYRAGFATGTALFEAEREEDAGRAEDLVRVELTDADIWPAVGSYT